MAAEERSEQSDSSLYNPSFSLAQAPDLLASIKSNKLIFPNLEANY